MRLFHLPVHRYVCKRKDESHIRKVQLQHDYFIPLGCIVGSKELLSFGSVELFVWVIWKPWNRRYLNTPTLKKKNISILLYSILYPVD